MRVDVHELLRRPARRRRATAAMARDEPGARSARAGRCGARPRSSRRPAAIGVHGGAAPRRVLRRLQHHHAGALAEQEAVPALVERAGGPLRLVVAGGQRPHGGERGDVQRDDRGLGPAGQHHVGPARPDHVDRVADGLGAGRAGADRGVHPGARAEFDADPPRRAVRHEHRHRERRQALPAAARAACRRRRGWRRPRRCRWTRPRRAAPAAPPAFPRPPTPPWPRRSRTARTGRAAAPGRGRAPWPGRPRPARRSGPAGWRAQSSVSTAAPLRPASMPSQVLGYVAAERRGRAEAGDDDTWLVCPHSSSAPSLRCRRGCHGAAASGPGDQAETSARRT